ncbi:MAG: 50S ribosomal protein L15 [Parachlamydiaceae bacterium]|nr:50S ribosomal protein L15 [Parachlamydiaceae bacterium]
MISLSTLKNTTRAYKRMKRVGRGAGSGLGKTCGRGEKGAGSRAGYKRRLGYEGGQFRTFMKIPQRGFNQARFRKPFDAVNLDQIESMFEEGEIVNLVSLAERGFLSGSSYGLKVLGNGELKKKVSIEAHAFSASAREKLSAGKFAFTLLESCQMTSEDSLSSDSDSDEK